MEVATEPDGSFPTVDSQSTVRTKSRSHPLHTCAVALLSMAHKAYQKVEQIHGFGSIARRLASLSSPVAYPILHQWLAILSFIDNQIIALENTAETFFPPSTHIFDQIDRLVNISETLPRKFDDAMAYSAMMVPQVPMLNWAVTHLSTGFDFLISTVGDWTFYGMKEKEIVVDDVNSGEPINETTPDQTPHDPKGHGHIEKQNTIEKSPILDEKQCGEAKVGKMKKKKKPRVRDIEDTKHAECVCKDILDTLENPGKVEDVGDEKSKIYIDDDAHEQETKGHEKTVVRASEATTKLNNGGSGLEMGHVEDPILELFDAGWHVK